MNSNFHNIPEADMKAAEEYKDGVIEMFISFRDIELEKRLPAGSDMISESSTWDKFIENEQWAWEITAELFPFLKDCDELRPEVMGSGTDSLMSEKSQPTTDL